MRKCLLAVLLIAVVRSGLAQDKAPAPATYSATAYPSYGSAAAPQNDQASAEAELPKADHLRLAADHLEAAGLKDEAQRIRKMESEERARSAAAPVQMVVVSLSMLELSRTELSNLDSERYGNVKGTSVLEWLTTLQAADKMPSEAASAASSHPKLLSLIEALRKDHFLQVLSEPNLAVAADRTASINVGGEISYKVKDAQGNEVKTFLGYGTRVELVAHVVSKDRIRLDVRYRVSDLGIAHSVQVGDQKIPGLNVRQIATTVDVRSKGTVVINAGLEQRKRAAAPSGLSGDKPVVEEYQTLVLLTAEIVTKDTPKTAYLAPSGQR